MRPGRHVGCAFGEFAQRIGKIKGSVQNRPNVGAGGPHGNETNRDTPQHFNFFFYATGITPAMTLKMVGEGSQYACAFVDAQGNPLDGGKAYRVHMPAHIPAKDFWSFTLYDNQTRSMLQTDQRLPAVGSLTKGLLVNADGSVDVYFGPKLQLARKATGCRPYPVRAGTPCSDCTARSSRGSTRPGDPVRSSRGRDLRGREAPKASVAYS
jgi:hypothetical protein